MVTIHTSDDILRLLANNPEWKAAVRREILTEELLNLPARFDQFVGKTEQFQSETQQAIGELRQFHENQLEFNEDQRRFNADTKEFIAEQRQFNEDQRQFNADTKEFIAEQRQFNDDQRQFNEDQRQFNARVEGFMERTDARFDRIEDDISNMRGEYARNSAIREADFIAENMGFQLVRVLTWDDLRDLLRTADTTGIPTSQLQSFRRADLVIETVDAGGATNYIAVEVSNSADERDTRRAIRNAGFLTRFTGHSALAAIASVRNDHRIQGTIDSGQVHWHPLPNRERAAE